MIPNLPFNSHFEANHIIRSKIRTSTLRSQIEWGIGAGVYFNSLSINESIKLDESVTIFLAELAEILRATRKIRETDIIAKHFTMHIQINTVRSF